MERFRAGHASDETPVLARRTHANLGDPREGWWYEGGRSQSRRLPSPLLFVLALILALTPSLNASFIGNFAFANFTLVNNDADGSAQTPDGGLSVILTGGNNGSGSEGTTDWVIQSLETGNVLFDYYYGSLDYPGFDYAGYLLNGNFVQVGDSDGTSGSAGFAVNDGDTFGFRVGTVDNTGEPGVLTISDFTFSPSGTQGSVPEPGTGGILLGAIAAVAVCRRASRIASNRERDS
jgi:hypothetical protein